MIPLCPSRSITTHADLLRAAVSGMAIDLCCANVLMALTDQDQAVIDRANRC